MNIFWTLISLLCCGTDVSIMKTYDKEPDTSIENKDTSHINIDTSNSEPSQETQQPSSEPSSEMTDLTIGFAEMSLTQIACPACMGVSSEFDIYGSLKLHQPTSGGYTDGLTPVGTCVTQQYGVSVASQPLNISGNVNFNSISLYPVGQSEWRFQNIPEYQYPRSQSITITTQSGTISNAFTSLRGFDDIQPWELRYVDPSYAFAAVVSKQGTTFSWQPVISGAQFEVLIAIYSPDGSQLLGMVSCMQYDQGWMTVPGNYFQQYPYWSLAAIYLSRHKIERNPAPEFNGWLESHQTWTVLGTGHIE